MVVLFIRSVGWSEVALVLIVGVDFEHRVIAPLFGVTPHSYTVELCYTLPKRLSLVLFFVSPAREC